MTSFRITLLFGLLFALAGCITDKEVSDNSLQPGDKCPEFSVTLIDGTVVNRASLLGRNTLIVFFNTECADCRRELTVVQEVYDKLTESDPSRSADVICIARSQTEASIRAYWQQNGLTLPVSPQQDNAVYRLFATIGIPRIYAIDPDGTITAAWTDDPLPTAAQLLEAMQPSEGSIH